MDDNQGFWRIILISCALFPIFSLFSRYNYPLFHTIIEFLAILVGFSIFLFSITTFQYSRNWVIRNLGVLYCLVGVVDFFHMITYKGISILPGLSSNVPTQFWIAGRLIETVGLLGSFFIPKKPSWFLIFMVTIVFISLGSIWSIFSGTFPDCYIDGSGLTFFKITMEYILIGLLMILLFILIKSDNKEIKPYRMGFALAVIFTSLAEASFTLYTDVYGFFNMFGHLFRFVSYLLILYGVLLVSLKHPFRTLLFEIDSEKHLLETAAYQDSLTGVFNRSFFHRWIKEHAPRTDLTENKSTLVMIDIDNFKMINDDYGHLVGDEVLKFIARTMQDIMRKGTSIFRYGGDEFVIIFQHTDLQEADSAIRRLDTIVQNGSSGFNFSLSISYGLAEFRSSEDLNRALHEADQKMYDMKNRKKG